MKAIYRKLTRFGRDEDGSQTVEAAIWVPFFMLFVVLVIDVSTVFNRQSEMLRIVQDANRAFSTGRIADTAGTEQFILEALAGFNITPTVVTTLDQGIISTRLSVPASDLMPINTIPVFADKTVVVATQHLAEF